MRQEHLYKCPECGETRWFTDDPKPFCEHADRVFRTMASRPVRPGRRADTLRGGQPVEIAGYPQVEVRT